MSCGKLLGMMLLVSTVWGQSDQRFSPAAVREPSLSRSALVAAPDEDPAVAKADQGFLDAVRDGQATMLAGLLDADFTWITADGKVFSKAEALKALDNPPAVRRSLLWPAIMTGLAKDGSFGGAGGPQAAEVKGYAYGDVFVVEANSGRMHALRIWAKRPSPGDRGHADAKWRALVYQEVQSAEAPLSFTPGAGSSCENPCKRIEYQAKNTTERAVVKAYEALESSAVAKDAEAWGAVTAEEFVAASSNSTQLLDRSTRMAQLAQKNMQGLSPTPLLSAKMFDFSGVVVMRSQHRPDRGLPLEVTRVWVKREGKWVATLSYQTSVRSADGR